MNIYKIGVLNVRRCKKKNTQSKRKLNLTELIKIKIVATAGGNT
jgi:hypothetical protein